MKRNIFVLVSVCFPLLIQAADLPNVVNENKAADLQMCIERAAADCVNTVCINSPDINCTDNCQQEGQNRCNEMDAE